jgi:hypothetical protein
VVAGPAEEKIDVRQIEIKGGEVYVEMRPEPLESKPKAA